MPPEPYAAVTADTTDEEILSRVDDPAGVVAAGVGWLQERFDASATDTTGVIQWEVTWADGRERWQVRVGDGVCEIADIDGDPNTEPRRADIIVATSLPEFVRIVAGAVDLMDRFTSGQVLVAGTLPLARALPQWFPLR